MRPWISISPDTLSDCGLLAISPSKKGAKGFKRVFSPLLHRFPLFGIFVSSFMFLYQVGYFQCIHDSLMLCDHV